MPRKVTCGTIVTDGHRLLMGHATHGSHWDIPKGLAEPGEDPVDAALRELAEETGLVATRAILRPLGRAPYNRDKDLELFLWPLPNLPDPAGLSCHSMVTVPGRPPFPEIDRFALIPWTDVPRFAAKRMAERLAAERANLGYEGKT